MHCRLNRVDIDKADASVGRGHIAVGVAHGLVAAATRVATVLLHREGHAVLYQPPQRPPEVWVWELPAATPRSDMTCEQAQGGRGTDQLSPAGLLHLEVVPHRPEDVEPGEQAAKQQEVVAPIICALVCKSEMELSAELETVEDNPQEGAAAYPRPSRAGKPRFERHPH